MPSGKGHSSSRLGTRLFELHRRPVTQRRVGMGTDRRLRMGITDDVAQFLRIADSLRDRQAEVHGTPIHGAGFEWTLHRCFPGGRHSVSQALRQDGTHCGRAVVILACGHVSARSVEMQMEDAGQRFFTERSRHANEIGAHASCV